MFKFFKKNKDDYKYYFYVIDDEEDILEVLDLLITKTFSCKIRTFSSMKDSLEALKKEMIAPDLIFSDIRMGKESGLCIRDQIKELGLNIPILFITGLTGDEGFHNGYWSINKPVSTVSLKKYTLQLIELAKKTA